MKKKTVHFFKIWVVFFVLMLSSCNPSNTSIPSPTDDLVSSSPADLVPSPTVNFVPSPSPEPLPSPSVPITPTLTFEDSQCNYSGPLILPSDFTLTWKINESKTTEYAYVVITLQDDKTLDDLKASLAISFDQPEWANLISRDIAAEGNLVLTKEHNMRVNGLYHGEPIYFVCFSDDSAYALGPITIKD